MTLSADTQQIMAQVEEATCRPVHLQPDPDLHSLAVAKIARGDTPAHVVTYRPAAQGADYALASQFGTVLRIFQSPPEQRADFVTRLEANVSHRRCVMAG
jgi:hypothetical protein